MDVVTDGTYQYGVEITVSDPTIGFIKKQYEIMREAVNILTRYKRSSIRTFEGKPSFSIATQQFSSEFVSRTDPKPILQAMEAYVGVLNILSNNYASRQLSSAALRLYCLVCPINGVATNIPKILSLFNLVIRELETILRIGYCTRPTRNYLPEGVAPIRVKKDTGFIVKPYIKWSSGYFNSLGQQNIGFYFLNATEGLSNGLVQVPWKAYEELIQRQALKLFGNISPFNLTTGIAVDMNRGLYSYLTPLSVGLGGKEKYNFFNVDHEFYKIDKYNSILSEILKINRGMTILGDDHAYSSNHDFTKFGQKLRNNLVDLLAFQGCTIDNIPAFASKRIGAKCEVLPPESKVSTVDKGDASRVDVVTPVVKNKTVSKRPYEDSETNPNNIFMRLASYDIFYNHDNVKPQVYDAGSLRFNLSSEDINTLPLSVKALYALYTRGSGHSTNINLASLQGNHRDHLGFLYFNFLNVMQVETLTGYEDGNLLKPQFAKLDLNLLNGRGLMLCRLQRYTHGYKRVYNLKIRYPIFHEYFILKYDGSKLKPQISSRTARGPRAVVRNTAGARISGPSTSMLPPLDIDDVDNNLSKVLSMVPSAAIHSSLSHITIYKGRKKRSTAAGSTATTTKTASTKRTAPSLPTDGGMGRGGY